MSATTVAEQRGFDHCCGAVEIGGFTTQVPGYYNPALTNVIDNTNTYVYKIATFTDTKVCKKAYDIMCDKLKLVSQTEPKKNPKSGNKVFVAVFTNKDK